jgi:TRAP-type C4-dicarboxylate transport system permease small subunit
MKQGGKAFFAFIACLVFVSLFFVVLAQLLGRVTGQSILFAEDASSILFIWFVMSGAVVAYQRREHLEVDLLHRAVAPKLSRSLFRLWSLFCAAAQLLFLGVFAAGLVVMARQTWDASYGSLAGFRYGYLYLGVLVCALCAMGIILRALIQDVRANSGDEM